MSRTRPRRPDRLPWRPRRPTVDLDPLAVLHHSPVLARADVRVHPWR